MLRFQVNITECHDLLRAGGNPEVDQELASLNTNQNPAGHFCLCLSLGNHCQTPAAICEGTLASQHGMKAEITCGCRNIFL